jgi:hypothetical protein
MQTLLTVILALYYMYEMICLFLARNIQNLEFAKTACVFSGADYAFPVLFTQASAGKCRTFLVKIKMKQKLIHAIISIWLSVAKVKVCCVRDTY